MNRFKIGDRVVCADRTDEGYLLPIRGIITVLNYTSVEGEQYHPDDRATVRLAAPYIEGYYPMESLFFDPDPTPFVGGEL